MDSDIRQSEVGTVDLLQPTLLKRGPCPVVQDILYPRDINRLTFLFYLNYSLSRYVRFTVKQKLKSTKPSVHTVRFQTRYQQKNYLPTLLPKMNNVINPKVCECVYKCCVDFFSRNILNEKCAYNNRTGKRLKIGIGGPSSRRKTETKDQSNPVKFDNR